jgi:hypothetical protein
MNKDLLKLLGTSAVAAMLLVGCGSSDDNSSTPDDGNTTTPTTYSTNILGVSDDNTTLEYDNDADGTADYTVALSALTLAYDANTSSWSVSDDNNETYALSSLYAMLDENNSSLADIFWINEADNTDISMQLENDVAATAITDPGTDDPGTDDPGTDDLLPF